MGDSTRPDSRTTDDLRERKRHATLTSKRQDGRKGKPQNRSYGVPLVFQNKKNQPYLTSYTKINSGQIKDLKVGGRPIQLLEGNTGLNIQGLRQLFLKCNTKAHLTKGKKKKQTNRTSCKTPTSKNTIMKMGENRENGRKHLQIMCLIRAQYSEYTENS